MQGQELGRHAGLTFYTVGQRKGLGITWPEPLYVLDIDLARNALIVGPATQLGRGIVHIKEASFVAGEAPLLVVREGKREYLIPLAQEFLGRMDTAAKRIEMELPEGMLELDAPLSKDEKRSQSQEGS